MQDAKYPDSPPSVPSALWAPCRHRCAAPACGQLAWLACLTLAACESHRTRTARHRTNRRSRSHVPSPPSTAPPRNRSISRNCSSARHASGKRNRLCAVESAGAFRRRPRLSGNCPPSPAFRAKPAHERRPARSTGPAGPQRPAVAPHRRDFPRGSGLPGATSRIWLSLWRLREGHERQPLRTRERAGNACRPG